MSNQPKEKGTAGAVTEQQLAQVCNVHGLACRLKAHNLIAYMRGEDDETISRQKLVIDEYCLRNGYKIIEQFVDHDAYQDTGYLNATEALSKADGLIVAEVNCLVMHKDSRWRDLRPLLHHFGGLAGKHLICVAEGINTGSSAGQIALTELMTQQKDPGETPFLQLEV